MHASIGKFLIWQSILNSPNRQIKNLLPKFPAIQYTRITLLWYAYILNFISWKFIHWIEFIKLPGIGICIVCCIGYLVLYTFVCEHFCYVDKNFAKPSASTFALQNKIRGKIFANAVKVATYYPYAIFNARQKIRSIKFSPLRALAKLVKLFSRVFCEGNITS